MQELFLKLDVSLFYFLNKTLANSIFDIIMPFITEFKTWLPIYIIGLSYIIYSKKWKGLAIVLALIVAIILADQISASIIKPLINRLRPCHSLQNIHLLVGCGGGKSFPSSHATNNFAAAIILSRYYKNLMSVFFGIATLVALSRVFVGVHYPFDITAGAFLGLGIGYIILIISEFLNQKIQLKFPNFDKSWKL